MSQRKPLVLDDTASVEQLQAGDELDIPLEDRVEKMNCQLLALARYLMRQGIRVPPELERQL